MNPIHILRDSLRITLRARAVWILSFLLYPVMIPALVLSGGLGAVSSAVMLPEGQNPMTTLHLTLPDLPAAAWVLILLLSLAVLTVTSLLAWAVQAAMIRAADAAADGKAISIADALNLGRERWGSLLKLAITFGLVIQALGVLPALLAILLRGNSAWGAVVLPLVQTFLSPFNILLGILVFLLMMAVALEDARPRKAFRRVGELIRSGWWGFLLAYLLQGMLAMAVAFVFAFVLALVLILFTAAQLSGSTAGSAIAVGICILASPVGLALMTFVMVFSTVYFTLTYRGAAAETAGRAAHPPD